MTEAAESLINAINEPALKRKHIALGYRRLILSKENDQEVISKINQAIIKRWSNSALLFIKNLAWSGKPIK
jgi:hypothetical protein